jgi:bacteriocin-like protein
MSLIKSIERLRYIDHLIRTKTGGNAKRLAGKLHLSRSTTLEYLKEMRELGFPIKYCNKRRIYYYDEEGKMVENLFIKKMDDEEMKKIIGGRGFTKFPLSDYIGLLNNNFTK